MHIQQWGFLLDMILAGTAVWFALRDVRIWWAYIIAGEMVFTLGMSVLFGIFGIKELGWDDNGWYFVYGITQGVALLMLLMCLARTNAVSLYAIAGVLSLGLGLSGDIHGGFEGAGYTGLVVFFGAVKVGIMVHYWRNILCFRRYHGFNRIHVWQD